MFELYFGSLFAVVTTVLVLGMLAFIAVVYARRERIPAWGRYILVFVLVGTAISAMSATRDAYMTEAALFAVDGLQSTLCSIAGGLISLSGLAALFVRKQAFRKGVFGFIAVLFGIQVTVIEISRIMMY